MMLTKFTVLLLVLSLSAPCLAQQPRIDSIAVDEDKGELVLHGNFQNPASAIVLVDSVSLPVTMASDTLIRVTIPVSGKGSAGWVQTIIGANQSNSRILSYWHLHIFRSHSHAYSDGGGEGSSNDFTLHYRADILNHNFSTGWFIPLSKLSRYHATADGHDGIHGYKYGGPHYDSTGILSIPIWFDSYKSSYYDFEDPYNPYLSADVDLDDNYQIIPGNQDNNCDIPGAGDCFHWAAIAPTDFPPSSASVLEAPSNQNILQAHLSSDPIAPNADVIITLLEAMNVRMEILDILGHIISSDEKMLQAGINKLAINSSALASGMYICRLQAGGEVVSVRFVKLSEP